MAAYARVRLALALALDEPGQLVDVLLRRPARTLSAAQGSRSSLAWRTSRSPSGSPVSIEIQARSRRRARRAVPIRVTVDIAPREDRAFDRALPTPAGHFDLYVFAALLRLREQLPGIDDPDGAAAFPFLHAYFDQLPDWARDVPAREGWRRWCVEIESFERAVAGHLPLRALRKDAALDHFDLTLLFCAGLVDEDSRFGALFEALQPEGRRRPTVGLLSGWAGNPGDRRVARTAVARLIRLGLLRSVAADPAVTDSRGPPGDGAVGCPARRRS